MPIGNAQNIKGCSGKVVGIIKTQLKKIEAASSKTPEKRVNYIKRIVKQKCNKKITSMNLIDRKIKKSLKGRISNISKHLEYASNFRDIENDLKKLIKEEKNLSQKYKFKGNKVKYGKWRKIIREGKKNQSKRKLTCENIDLRNEATKKVHDQFGTEWCFAFSAADLISQHIGEEVSRVHLATLYNKYNFSKVFDRLKNKSQPLVKGGMQSFALSVAKRKGICLEEDSSSEAYEIGVKERGRLRHHNKKERERKLTKDLAEQKRLYRIIDKGLEKNANASQKRKSKIALAKLRKLRKIDENDSNGLFNEITFIERLYLDYHGTKRGKELVLKQLRQDYFNEKGKLKCSIKQIMLPNLDFSTFEKILKNSNRYNFYHDIQSGSCKKRKLNYKIHNKIGFGKVVSAYLDRALSHKRMGSISYDTKVFSRPYMNPLIPISDHVSTIVGREWNSKKNRCEYILKNTKGVNGFGKNGYKNIPEEFLSKFVNSVSFITD